MTTDNHGKGELFVVGAQLIERGDMVCIKDDGKAYPVPKQSIIALNDAAPAKARRDDPVESHAAAASVKAEHTSKLKALILLAMRNTTGMSDETLADVVAGCATEGFKFTEAGVRSRRAELQARGYIEDTDKLGVTVAGRACRLRRLTEAGRKEVGL